MFSMLGHSSHILGWAICVCVLLQSVQTYDKVYEFRNQCNQQVNIMPQDQKYLVLYSGETLPVSNCSIAFVAKDDNFPICVRPVEFHITNCNFIVQYYRKKGSVEMSFSCKAHPQEFCVRDKDLLFINIENGNVYQDAYIELEVSSEKQNFLFLIGVAAGVVVLSCVAYCILKPKIQECRKKRAAAAQQRNRGTQNVSSQNQPAPKGNPKKAEQKSATKPSAAEANPSTNQQAKKNATAKPTQQNDQLPLETSQKKGLGTGNPKSPNKDGQAASLPSQSLSTTPGQPEAKTIKPIQSPLDKNASPKQGQPLLQQRESSHSLLPAPEEPQLLQGTLITENIAMSQQSLPTTAQTGQRQGEGIVNSLHIPVAPVPDYHTLYDTPPPPYKEKE